MADITDPYSYPPYVRPKLMVLGGGPKGTPLVISDSDRGLAPNREIRAERSGPRHVDSVMQSSDYVVKQVAESWDEASQSIRKFVKPYDPEITADQYAQIHGLVQPTSLAKPHR